VYNLINQLDCAPTTYPPISRKRRVIVMQGIKRHELIDSAGHLSEKRINLAEVSQAWSRLAIKK